MSIDPTMLAKAAGGGGLDFTSTTKSSSDGVFNYNSDLIIGGSKSNTTEELIKWGSIIIITTLAFKFFRKK